MTFKKNDTVKCIRTVGGNSRFGQMNATYKVLDTRNLFGDQQVQIETPGWGKGWMDAARFELVKAAETTFKVGDRIRVKADYYERCKGLHGTVAAVQDHNLLVRLPGFDGHDGSGLYGNKMKTKDHWYLTPVNLELDVEAPVKTPEKVTFKVGDRVVGHGMHDGKSIDLIGGSIISVCSRDADALVEFDAPFRGHGPRSNQWHVPMKKLTLAPAPTITEELGGSITSGTRATPSKFFIITVLDAKGAPKPATAPKTYKTAEQARAVAREMAEKHRGEVFVVLEAVGASALPVTPETPYVSL